MTAILAFFIYYLYGKVEAVKEGLEGQVHSATVAYRIPGKKTFRTTDCPIHNLAMMVPVGYKFEEDFKTTEAPAV